MRFKNECLMSRKWQREQGDIAYHKMEIFMFRFYYLGLRVGSLKEEDESSQKSKIIRPISLMCFDLLGASKSTIKLYSIYVQHSGALIAIDFFSFSYIFFSLFSSSQATSTTTNHQ